MARSRPPCVGTLYLHLRRLYIKRPRERDRKARIAIIRVCDRGPAFREDFHTYATRKDYIDTKTTLMYLLGHWTCNNYRLYNEDNPEYGIYKVKRITMAEFNRLVTKHRADEAYVRRSLV